MKKEHKVAPQRDILDNGDLFGDPIPTAQLPAAYRAQAARLRCEADTAESIEMRVVLLNVADEFDRLAKTSEEERR